MWFRAEDEGRAPPEVSESEPPRPPRRRRLKWAALALLALIGAAVGLFTWGVAGIDPSAALEPLDQPRVVLETSDGQPFARRGQYKERPVDVAALPPHVVNAFIAIEDRRFFRHGGVDMGGIVRAAVRNAQAGEVVQGGSTITQQLAKTYVGSDRTFARKLREGVVALWLERRLTKNEILSYYLSSAYFGDGVYGLRAAARHYFGKAPEKLSLGEAAMLAGLVKAPSRLAPTRNLEGARARSRLVLDAMVETGAITIEEAKAAKLARPRRIAALPGGGYFADWIAPALRRDLQPQFGEVRVRTTLDAGLQARAEEVVRTVLARRGARDRVGQAALVAMRTDGSVVAMVGGRDYAKNQFNRAVQARRQPGSAFKLFVYLAALRDGARPDSLVSNAPIKVGAWSPRNAGGRYEGPLTLEEAFARSSNVAAVRISEHVGRNEVIRAARDLGVASDLKPVPSLALGASEVTLLEMTSAYAGVAGGAYPVAAHGVGAAQPAPHRLDWGEEQEPMLRLLRTAAEQGTGRGAALPIPVFGKTGTTQDNRDAWFVGFAGDLVTGVWVGNDDETPTRVGGSAMPAQIWRAFMQTALADEIDAYQRFLAAEAEARRLEELEAEAERQRNWVDRFFDFVRPQFRAFGL